MKTSLKNNIEFVFFILIIAIASFFIGKYYGCKPNQAETPEITITGSVDTSQFIPTKEETPDKPILPLKPDVVYRDTGSIKYVSRLVDTAAIIADYIKKRDYKIKPFDSKETGTLELYPQIQYNKLIGLDYSFTPAVKTCYKEKVWQPFVSASYSTLDDIGIGGGFFYHNLGFEYQYQRNFKYDENGHSLGLKYRF